MVPFFGPPCTVPLATFDCSDNLLLRFTISIIFCGVFSQLPATVIKCSSAPGVSIRTTLSDYRKLNRPAVCLIFCVQYFVLNNFVTDLWLFLVARFVFNSFQRSIKKSLPEGSTVVRIKEVSMKKKQIGMIQETDSHATIMISVAVRGFTYLGGLVCASYENIHFSLSLIHI